jgi:23S rRNA (pseudouridine1915-N3)-methyltransferase
MKVELWVIGKTNFDYLKEGIKIYENRLNHYLSFELKIIPDLKNSKNFSTDQIKQKEGGLILPKLQKNDFLILLDEKGKEFSSIAFAQYMDRQLQSSRKKIIFLIGGAYGFSKEVYERANGKIALSIMTFSHQMIRLFFLEQLYRSMTIIKGEPYHNQ